MIPAFTESPVKSLDPLTRAVLHGPVMLHFDQGGEPGTWQNDFIKDEIPYRARELVNQPRFVRSVNLFGFMLCAYNQKQQAHYGLKDGYLLKDAIALATKQLRAFITEARDLGVEDGEAVAYADVYEFLCGDERAYQNTLPFEKAYDKAHAKAAAAIRKVLKDSGASKFFRYVITDGGCKVGKFPRYDFNGWKQNVNTTVDGSETSCVWAGQQVGKRATPETCIVENRNQIRSVAAVGRLVVGLCTMPQRNQAGPFTTWQEHLAGNEAILAEAADAGPLVELHIFNAIPFPNDYPHPMPSEAQAEDAMAEMIVKHSKNVNRRASKLPEIPLS